MTSESVRGHHDENFEGSQAEPLSKDEHARAFLRFLDFSARNLQGKTEIQIFDLRLQNLLEDIMRRILNGHNINL